MPFVKRVVLPTLLCRASDASRTPSCDDGRLLKDDSELVAVSNCALSNAIRQLASLAGHADDIFVQLKAQLGEINARASLVKEKLANVQANADKLNARQVTVPEGDLTTTWHRKSHYAATHPTTKGLFTPESRPAEVQQLYEAAGQTPVLKMRQFDRLRRDGRRASKIFMCTPVLSSAENRKVRKAILDEIETSKPAAWSRVREWRSSEVLGSSVAPPDVSLAPPLDASSNVDLEHLLPSPEEQQSVVARHFPPEMVAVDVSGRNFDRQQRSRRSLSQIDTRRAERHRKRRSQRRNTIAGTSAEAELLRQSADGASQLGGSESIEVDSSLQSLSGSKRTKGSTDKMGDRMLSHLHSLRAWGRQRLSRKEQQPNDLYETLAHIRRPRSTSPHVRLRTNTGRMSKRDVHSSSGNWSASSSSARASVESSSENRTTSHLPTSSSSSTCDSALSVRRPKATSVSSSNSRESPDLPVSDSTGFNDGETSSVYSCDTEGYYTSFHVDSGLKTLREEPFESTNSSGNITVCAAQISTQALCENEYELFGKGSTSTTASSAGTICTVKAPPSPPLRRSSLENVNSDNDTVERRARVRQALGANRIPSMCAITPPLSEDEQPSRPPSEQKSRASPQLKAALLPFNSIMGKMREVLRKSPAKETPSPRQSPVDEYVTIAAADTMRTHDEYVSLNELPVQQPQSPGADSESESGAKSPVNSLERRRRSGGARVTLDSDGKVVYSSDSLKRRPKGTTFEPGPCVKDATDAPKNTPPKTPIRAISGARLIIKATPTPVVSLAGKQPSGPHVDMLRLAEKLADERGDEEPSAAGGGAQARENIDPNGWVRGVRRNESYRLASNHPPDDVKQVVNPNTVGRKFYGAKIMVDPNRMVRHQQQPIYETQPPLARITVPPDTQRARVLSSGYTNGHHYGAPGPPSFCTIPRSWDRSHQQQQQPQMQQQQYQYQSFQGGSVSSTPTKQYFRPPDCTLSPISSPSFSSPSSPVGSPSRRPLVSKPRSTMSTDELYAAIHRSKKKMNIKDDMLCSPTPSTCSSPVESERGGSPGSRHSWSPCSPEALNGGAAVSATARNSFKRLLLEKGAKGGPKVSAVEQLMATKGHFAPKPTGGATLHHSLGRRRYRHTDVLSTTIAEESEPPAHKLPPHLAARYLQQRIDQMCLSPRLSPARAANAAPAAITFKPPSPSKMSLETSL